jgi:hypothetical protein
MHDGMRVKTRFRHRVFTIVPSRFHHRTIVISPSYHRVFKSCHRLPVAMHKGTVLSKMYAFSLFNLHPFYLRIFEILVFKTLKIAPKLNKNRLNRVMFPEKVLNTGKYKKWTKGMNSKIRQGRVMFFLQCTSIQ